MFFKKLRQRLKTGSKPSNKSRITSTSSSHGNGLCQYCQSITIEGLVSRVAEDDWYSFCDGINHQPSFDALVESAKTCELCQIFHRCILEDIPPKSESDSVVPRPRVNAETIHGLNPRRSGDHNRHMSEATALSIQPNFSNGFSNLQLRTVTIESQMYNYMGTLEVFAEQGKEILFTHLGRVDVRRGSPAAISGTVAGRPLPEYPTSNESLSLFRHWIQDCRENHPLCARPLISGRTVNYSESSESTAFPMPTRLLNVSSGIPGEIKLVVSDEIPHPYVALSHRWGKVEDTACTTMRNLSERMKRISLTDLSPLFRDAVEITRLLGINYLWIDSLCIIQDDAVEWNREAAKMSDTFEHAELVVSALRSGDGHSAFLGPRDLFSVAIPFRTNHGAKAQGSISLRLGASSRELSHSSLNQRGWVFQERILPRRILSFSNRTTYFECRSLTRDEGSSTPWPAYKTSHRQFIDKLERLSIDPHDPRNKNSVFKEWLDMTRGLSVYQLTYEQDRLPAFLGLAKRMARVVDSTYAHGLWAEDIILGLSWQIYLHRPSGTDSRIISPKTARKAPTWSWASSGGNRIIFGTIVEDELVIHPTARLALPRKSWDEALELKLEAPMSLCALSNTYAVKEDFIGVDSNDRDYWISSGLPKNKLEDSSGQVIGAVVLDREPPYYGTYQSILLCNGRIDQWGANVGLLLHAVEGMDLVFQRIGLVHFNNVDFFNDANRVIVTLI